MVREVVGVDCEVKQSTAKMMQIKAKDDRVIWIPLASVIEIHPSRGYIVIDKKIADREGL